MNILYTFFFVYMSYMPWTCHTNTHTHTHTHTKLGQIRRGPRGLSKDATAQRCRFLFSSTVLFDHSLFGFLYNRKFGEVRKDRNAAAQKWF